MWLKKHNLNIIVIAKTPPLHPVCNNYAKYSKHVDYYYYSPSRPMTRPCQSDRKRQTWEGNPLLHPPPHATHFIRIKYTYRIGGKCEVARALEKISFVGHMVLRGLNWIHFHFGLAISTVTPSLEQWQGRKSANTQKNWKYVRFVFIESFLGGWWCPDIWFTCY